MNFHFDKSYHIFLQVEKAKFISSIFNVQLFILTKILLFRFFHPTYDSHIFKTIRFYFILNLECI